MSLKPEAPAIRRILSGPAPGWMAVSRGTALGLSCLMVLNLVEIFAYSTSSVGNWITNLSPLPLPAGVTVLAMLATSLVMFSMRPAVPGPVLFASISLLTLFAGFCGRELWEISQGGAELTQATAMTRPLGIIMLLAVAGFGVLAGNSDSARGRSSFLAILFAAALTLFGFAIVTIQSGGLADGVPGKTVPVVLVLGCERDPAGTLPESVTDRVRTGIQLVLEKHGELLVLAGRHEQRAESDSDAIKSLAVSSGLLEKQVLLNADSSGFDASIKSASQLPQLKNDRRLIVVGHWYELARIRFLAKRSGLEVTAVPAHQQHALFNQNVLVLREAVAVVVSLFEPALQFAGNASSPAAPVAREGQRADN